MAASSISAVFSGDNDSSLFSGAVVTLYVSAAFNVLILPFISAPYGKHLRSGWGPTVPPSLAWFLMESPTLWLSLLLFPLGRHHRRPLPFLLLSLYLLHYLHRTIIYPLRLRSNSKPFPFSVALMAFTFNVLNAYIQIRSISHYAAAAIPSAGGRIRIWIWIRILIGLGIFAWGMRTNVRSDLALVKLKKEGGGGYRIPRGGWFEWVCNPNYMGEVAEWLGWAVVAGGSPAAAGFFLYTCSNLVPRARANLRWYREKFGAEYPKSRKAIVPLVF